MTRSRLRIVAAVIAAAVFCITVHLLIVDPALQPAALLLITAPWLLVGASKAASTARSRSTRPAIAVLVIGSLLAIASWAVWRVGQRLGDRADLLMFAESTLFLLSLALLFGASLFSGREPLVTRLARVERSGDVTPAIVRYTRRVTVGWALFFLAAAAIATVLFTTQSREAWSAFINLALWPLTVVAFAVEYAIRIRVLADVAHASPWSGLQAFMRRGAIESDLARERVR